MTNPYKVLGVSDDATNEEIRAAYLSLVKKYHPDKYTDPDLKALANEKLKEINEAYGVLSDSEKKARYDQYGHAGVDPNFGAGGAGGVAAVVSDPVGCVGSGRGCWILSGLVCVSSYYMRFTRCRV